MLGVQTYADSLAAILSTISQEPTSSHKPSGRLGTAMHRMYVLGRQDDEVCQDTPYCSHPST